MAKMERTLSNVRKKIEREIEQKIEERRRKLKVQRLEVARTGILAYKNRRFAEAVRNFLKYIAVLEEIHQVSPGGLTPSHFDLKKDLSELLMISGIYWDLVKLYDRTRSKARYNEFRHYLQKYVLFSKDMPFQALCAEAVRKYITTEKAMHSQDFKAAYKVLSTYKCFIATSLVDVVAEPTIPKLRNYRDQTLLRSWLGRQFVASYYKCGPFAASAIDRLPQPVRKVFGKTLDRAARLLTFKAKRS